MTTTTDTLHWPTACMYIAYWFVCCGEPPHNYYMAKQEPRAYDDIIVIAGTHRASRNVLLS